MAERTWFGGTGAFGDPNGWSPAGAPLPGDVARIDAGTCVAAHASLGGVAIALQGADAGRHGTLSLDDTLVGNIALGHPVAGDAGGVATITVAHLATFAGNVVGDAAGNALTIALADGAVVVNGGTIEETARGRLDVTGGHGVLVNDGLIHVDAGITIDAAVLGRGTVELGTPLAAAPSSATLDGFVGPRQTFAFAGTDAQLEIARAREFYGAIVGFGAGDSIRLDGVAAGAASYQNGALTLFDGHAPVVSLRLDGSHATRDFTVAHNGGNTFITIAASG